VTPDQASVAGLSDVGRTRTGNEDSLLIEPPLYAVADGLGGHRAGEVASTLALEVLMAEAPKRVDAKALGRAVRSANRAVISSAEQGRNQAGMGTTLTAVMVDGTHLAVAQVGDSRAYLLHKGKLQQITQDHSMVADLIRSGSLTEEEARYHPQRSVITRALGSDPNMVADVFEYDATAADRLLLTTDGLTTMIDDRHIAEILADARTPDEAARRLVDAANSAGGYDNITVIVLDLASTPASQLSPARGSGEARRRVAARLLWVVAAAMLVIAAVWGAYAYARSRAYLIDQGGYVAVYRGVPGSFAGVSLSWPVETTRIPVSALDPAVASRLTEGIAFNGLADAFARVEELKGLAAPGTATPAPPAPAPPAP
jgi:PPM family protein phosphatase